MSCKIFTVDDTVDWYRAKEICKWKKRRDNTKGEIRTKKKFVTVDPNTCCRDAIIIGVGHNGMALAGKSGWGVLVLESRYEEGGGLSTEGYTEPSLLHF